MKKITTNIVLTCENATDEDGITYNDADEFIAAVKNGWLANFFPNMSIEIKTAKSKEI